VKSTYFSIQSSPGHSKEVIENWKNHSMVSNDMAILCVCHKLLPCTFTPVSVLIEQYFPA
jgi:hypothetical protein